MNGFWSPTTTTWPTIGFARIGSSSAAGATFLPPAVTMISFLRPVIVRKPSSSSAPMSPVWNQSPSNDLGGRLGVVPVLLEDVDALDLDLAVVGDPDADAGQRGADGADLGLVGEVDRRGRGGLGEAVALEDHDAEAAEEVAEARCRAAPSPRRRTRTLPPMAARSLL